jgi:hypothetical protein
MAGLLEFDDGDENSGDVDDFSADTLVDTLLPFVLPKLRLMDVRGENEVTVIVCIAAMF